MGLTLSKDFFKGNKPIKHSDLFYHGTLYHLEVWNSHYKNPFAKKQVVTYILSVYKGRKKVGDKLFTTTRRIETIAKRIIDFDDKYYGGVF